MAVSTVGVVSDPIADMLTRIRNANSARHADVTVPASGLKLEIARVLRDEGYIAGYDVEKNADRAGEVVKITFKARPDRKRVISGVKRISRPGRRVYFGRADVPDVLAGLPLRGQNQWPEGTPDLRADMTAYFRALGAMCDRMLPAFAVALDLPEDFFAPHQGTFNFLFVDGSVRPVVTGISLSILQALAEQGRLVRTGIGYRLKAPD